VGAPKWATSGSTTLIILNQTVLFGIRRFDRGSGCRMCHTNRIYGSVVTIVMDCSTDGEQNPIMASLEGRIMRKFCPLSFTS
jgi:hypothetical protein